MTIAIVNQHTAVLLIMEDTIKAVIILSITAPNTTIAGTTIAGTTIVDTAEAITAPNTTTAGTTIVDMVIVGITKVDMVMAATTTKKESSAKALGRSNLAD
jgi:hypothetical protein